MIRPFPTRDRMDQSTLTEKKNVMRAVESWGTEAGSENVELDSAAELFSNSVSLSHKSAELLFMMVFFLEKKNCWQLDKMAFLGLLNLYSNRPFFGN